MNDLIFGIDSATLTIPRACVTFPSNILSESVRTYVESTGEELSAHQLNSYIERFDGVTTKYQIANQAFTPDGQMDVVRVTINAKQLGHKYLSGINKDNYFDVYQYILNQGHIKLSKDDWMNSWITEADFKVDFYLHSDKDVFNNIKAISERTKLELKTKGESTYREYLSKSNLGIEYYQRNKRAYKGAISPKHQNTRVYAKGVELFNNSYDFYMKYLSGVKVDNILRVETWGGKNKQSFANYGIINTRFKDVVKLTLDDCLPMFQKPFGHFLEHHYKKPISNGVSHNEISQKITIDAYMELLSLDINAAIDLLITEVSKSKPFSPSEKTRYRTKIFDIYGRVSNMDFEPLEAPQMDDKLNDLLGIGLS